EEIRAQKRGDRPGRSFRLRDTRWILPGDPPGHQRAEESRSLASCRETDPGDDRDRRRVERDPKCIVPVYRRAAERHARFGLVAESRWCSSGFDCRTESDPRMDTADGKSAN